MKRIFCLTALLVSFLAAGPGLAQDTQMIKGRAMRDLVVGNTAHIHFPACADQKPNVMLYFAEDGSIRAAERQCNLAMDRAQRLTGTWRLTGNRFCIRGAVVGDVQDHCLTMVKIHGNVYKRIDRTGLRTSWSMAIIVEGNPDEL